MASPGVATRDWSFKAALAGRTPGTTIRNFGPHARRIARASCADATTPSSPASFASRAKATARDAGDPETPTRRSAAASMLVKIVTPSSAGPLCLPATASRAAAASSRPRRGVDVDHPHLRQLRRSGDRSGHCVRNVVELEIEENLEAQARELFNRPRAFRSKELASDFEEACCAAKTPRQGAGRTLGGQHPARRLVVTIRGGA